MKKIIIIIALIAISVIGLVVYKNNPVDNVATAQKEVLSAHIKSVSGQIIDVREPSEYIESHADGAINVPLGEILIGNFSKIDKTRPIYVYCHSGVRAGKAKIALEQAGYKNVTSLGGLGDWIAKGGVTCGSINPSCE